MALILDMPRIRRFCGTGNSLLFYRLKTFYQLKDIRAGAVFERVSGLISVYWLVWLMEHISCLYQAAGGVFQALLALVPASPDKCAGLK